MLWFYRIWHVISGFINGDLYLMFMEGFFSVSAGKAAPLSFLPQER